jgi:hypothetical protein
MADVAVPMTFGAPGELSGCGLVLAGRRISVLTLQSTRRRRFV